MFLKIGIGIVGYVLMIYFIIFVTVKMFNFLSESFVGISLSEACHRLVWGEVIDKEDYEELLSSTHKKELTKNEAINDLLEDSKDYKMNYKSSFLTSDGVGIDLVGKAFGETIKHMDEDAPIEISSTKVLNHHQFTDKQRAMEFMKIAERMGYKTKFQQISNDFYNVTLIEEEE